MLFSTLFRALRRSRQGTARARQGGFRPRLEALEDRCVPTRMTWPVTSSADSLAPNTLPWAVSKAQNGDIIDIQPEVYHYFPMTGTGNLTATVPQDIVLTLGELVLNHNVTIESTGPVPTISGDNLSRVFEVAPGANVTLLNLNITQGNGLAHNMSGDAGKDGDGGAILNAGALVLTGCTVSNSNAVGWGGGIGSLGNLSLSNCNVTGNKSGNGGGICSEGKLTVVGGSIFNNHASLYGGGIFSSWGCSANIGNLTENLTVLTSNTAGYDGGGIANEGNTTLKNATLSGNSTSAGYGGGIYNFATLTVELDTFMNNNPQALVEGLGATLTNLGNNLGL